jgi:HSP20 family molecular chaperone IbpA
MRDFDGFYREYDAIFGNVFSDAIARQTSAILKVTSDKEEDGTLKIKFMVPGFEKDDIKVKSNKNNLIILVKEERKEYNVAAAYALRKLTAKLKNGVLEVTIPVRENEEEISVNIE